MASIVELVINAKDNASGVLKGITGTMSSMAKVAGGALVAGIGAAGVAMTGFLVSSVKEAMDAQNALAQLEAVIKSTGGAAGVTAKEVTDLADALSETTRFTDEAIIGAESMLLTFTNIGEDVFPQATETVLDMSQALGQDLKSSAIQLGKALNDPIQGVTALQRVGVQFTESEKKMIESLVRNGKLEEAQAVILKELQKEFGGSAKAAGETFAGQLDILRNKLSNLKEDVGMAIIPALTRLGNLFMGLLSDPAVLAGLEAFANGVANIADRFVDFISIIGDPARLKAAIGNLLGIDTIAEALAFDNDTVGFLATKLSDWIKAGIEAIDWTAAGAAVRQGFISLFQGAGEAAGGFDFAGVFANLTQGVAEFFAGLFGTTFDQVRAQADAFWFDFGMKIAVAVQSFVTKFNTLKSGIIQVFSTIRTLVTASMGSMTGIVIGFINKMINAFTGIAGAVGALINKIKDLARAFASLVIPDWLVPGSPTPFELGLLGINDALKKVQNTMPTFGVTAPSSGFTPAPAAPVSSPVIIQLTYAPAVSMASEAELERHLMPVIQRGLRQGRRQ